MKFLFLSFDFVLKYNVLVLDRLLDGHRISVMALSAVYEALLIDVDWSDA